MPAPTCGIASGRPWEAQAAFLAVRATVLLENATSHQPQSVQLVDFTDGRRSLVGVVRFESRAGLGAIDFLALLLPPGNPVNGAEPFFYLWEHNYKNRTETLADQGHGGCDYEKVARGKERKMPCRR